MHLYHHTILVPRLSLHDCMQVMKNWVGPGNEATIILQGNKCCCDQRFVVLVNEQLNCMEMLLRKFLYIP